MILKSKVLIGLVIFSMITLPVNSQNPKIKLSTKDTSDYLIKPGVTLENSWKLLIPFT